MTVGRPNTSQTPATTAAAQGLLKNLPLTDTDLRIIAHLQADGRRPFATIARDIGMTEKTVRTRTKHLLEENIIQIVALTTPAALGYTVSALAAISIASPMSGTAISDALAHIPAIDYVVLAHGRYPIFAEIMARDMQELQATIENEIGQIPGVTGVELFPYFSIYYQQACIMDHRAAPEDAERGVRDRELDPEDKAIVSELALDGRASFTELAERLSMSPNQVRFRVQHMLATRQMRIMAIVNPMKLLDRTMAWIAVKAGSTTSLDDLADALAATPHVSYVAICAGRFDMFVEVICGSMRELMDILDSRIRPLEGVAATETFIYVNLHYKRLLPVQARESGGPEGDRIHSFRSVHP